MAFGVNENPFDISILSPQSIKKSGDNKGFLGGQEFILDAKGRIRVDEEGNLIPVGLRRKFSKFARNPFGANIGNVFDPNFTFKNLPSEISQGLSLPTGGISDGLFGGLV